MNRRVIVKEFDDRWPAMFKDEKQRIFSALGTQNILAIHHIGSTSVPGLSAKPIIDILMEVACLNRLDNSSDKIAALGYICKGEYGLKGRRYFYRGNEKRTHHLHTYQQGDVSIKRHLAFRDYLLAHKDVCQRYAEIKREAVIASDIPKDYQQYKSDFISSFEQRALVWLQSQE
ncbi:GrpB family protein [Pleionea sp. CnH1-48]|uniref:GrpB family protein n=1 Tax=Pleionea sp. CnH1-48 TaxID=2954494 RepID=UPI002096CDCD|nr:GrpB family protein [Pleionea sp. CnH1-48]MCO7225685.1 GrpB family protein [Pleionea sp. CnH1-48]